MVNTFLFGMKFPNEFICNFEYARLILITLLFIKMMVEENSSEIIIYFI